MNIYVSFLWIQEQAEKQPKLKEDEEDEGDSAKDDQIVIMEEGELSLHNGH